MVEEVRGLRLDALAVLGRGRERELDAFLADLLRDLHGAFPRELRRVALLRRRTLEARVDDPLELGEKRDAFRVTHRRLSSALRGAPSAGGRTGMPSASRERFRSGMRIAAEWKTRAASAPSTRARWKTSRKCSIAPAPPDAISGMRTASRTSASCSMS